MNLIRSLEDIFHLFFLYFNLSSYLIFTGIGYVRHPIAANLFGENGHLMLLPLPHFLLLNSLSTPN